MGKKVQVNLIGDSVWVETRTGKHHEIKWWEIPAHCRDALIEMGLRQFLAGSVHRIDDPAEIDRRIKSRVAGLRAGILLGMDFEVLTEAVASVTGLNVKKAQEKLERLKAPELEAILKKAPVRMAMAAIRAERRAAALRAAAEKEGFSL